jgi:YesN/AraC family two-component response regulator
MTSQKAKILLVDDHTLILQGIKHVVSQMPEIEKVYTASSGAEAMLLVQMDLSGV